MDIRSAVLEHHPEVERAAKWVRISGYGSWFAGLVLLMAAIVTMEPVLLVVFTGWYVALAVLLTFVAAIPRKRQAALDQEWSRRYRELAIRDDLTGLFNRRYFNSELELQVKECRDSNSPLSIALIDLNNFKSINDSFGHQAGDMALRIAGQAILDASPRASIVARTGGDEFAVIMPGTSRAEAEEAAMRIHFAIEASNFVVQGEESGRGRIRGSIGLASLGEVYEPDRLLHEADTSLYAHKRALAKAS